MRAYANAQGGSDGVQCQFTIPSEPASVCIRVRSTGGRKKKISMQHLTLRLFCFPLFSLLPPAPPATPPPSVAPIAVTSLRKSAAGTYGSRNFRTVNILNTISVYQIRLLLQKSGLFCSYPYKARNSLRKELCSCVTNIASTMARPHTAHLVEWLLAAVPNKGVGSDRRAGHIRTKGLRSHEGMCAEVETK